MKIRNWKKFFRAILILIGIITFITFFIPDKSLSHQNVSYKNLSIVDGDTLWEIAKIEQKENSYYEGKDIRDIIYDIREVNNLESANLKINQILIIPTY